MKNPTNQERGGEGKGGLNKGVTPMLSKMQPSCDWWEGSHQKCSALFALHNSLWDIFSNEFLFWSQVFI